MLARLSFAQQEGEAADGVATTNIINTDIATTATGMGCPVSPIQKSPPPRCRFS